jgi:hypothetical protein
MPKRSAMLSTAPVSRALNCHTILLRGKSNDIDYASDLIPIHFDNDAFNQAFNTD